MGKSAPSAPPPPDPAQTAGAQTAQNVSTAIAQGQINNVNQVTPFGSLTYDQTGTYQMTDPNTGAVYDIPTYTATQSLTPEQQAIADAGEGAALNFGQIAEQQSGRLMETLGQPIEMGNEEVEARLMELGRSRLDPALEDRRASMANRLVQQGIAPGSEAYNREMELMMQSENDAYNQLLLQGRGQAIQEGLTERNQPINEITALLSGGQVTMPSFVNTNPAQLANVDRAGLEMSAYNAEMRNWENQQRQRQSMMGGLFGLGSSLISGGFF